MDEISKRLSASILEQGNDDDEAEKDIQLGRKIFTALAQRIITGSSFPSLLDLRDRVYAVHGDADSGRSSLAQDASISVLLQGQVVVYVDCDYRFDVLNFLYRIEAVCTSRKLPTHWFKSACRNMIVQKCGTSTELQLFVSYKLREILKTSDVGLVVVDSLTNFFWHDRYARAHWKAFHDSLWSSLNELRCEFAFTLMVIIQDLYCERKTPPDFLHCSKIAAESIRIRKTGEGRFELLLDSDERLLCVMQDGMFRRM